VNGFRTVMEIDTIGTFAMSRAAFPAMQRRGGGRIVNISATLHYGATWWQVIFPQSQVCAVDLRQAESAIVHSHECSRD